MKFRQAWGIVPRFKNGSYVLIIFSENIGSMIGCSRIKLNIKSKPTWFYKMNKIQPDSAKPLTTLWLNFEIKIRCSGTWFFASKNFSPITDVIVYIFSNSSGQAKKPFFSHTIGTWRNDRLTYNMLHILKGQSLTIFWSVCAYRWCEQNEHYCKYFWNHSRIDKHLIFLFFLKSTSEDSRFIIQSRRII